MNEITSDFSEIPKEYPPATGLDSLYVAEIATIGTLVVLDAAIIPGIEPSIETIAIAETLDLTLVDTLLIVRWTDTSLYAPATYQRVASNPGTGAAFQDAVGNWFSNIGPVFTPEMFGALGDGVTNDAAAITIAINAGAGGRGTTVFPGRTTPDFTAPAVYIIRSTMLIPSYCYLTVEPGVTIKVGNGANCSGFQIAANATNIQIDMFGTLDGNAANQTGAGGGIIGGPGSTPCSNVYVRGGKTGVVTNWTNWPTNLTSATNCEFNGLTFSNSGNSVEFAGISTRVNVVTGSYTTATGAITLNTGAIPHNISVGQTFTYVAATGSAAQVQGEYVALTVPDAFTVTTTAAAGLVGGNPTLNTGRVGTCAKCYNVGYVDCVASNIRDLGFGFYGGVVGGYIRNCEMQVGASGPFIFLDVGQPGSNVDCEISECYTHDGYGGGPTSTSGQAGVFNHNSRIFNNTVRNCARGGITISACDGADVYGNNLIGNLPAFDGTAQQCGQLLIAGDVTGLNINGNTILNPGQSSTNQTTFFINSAASTYNSTTGAVSLTTTASTSINVGDRFLVFDLFGTGNYLALNGWQTATAGTTGTTVNYTGTSGLGPITFLASVTPGSRLIAFTFAVSTTLVAGTYTSDGSGNLSLTTAAPHLMTSGDTFVLSGVGGSGVPGYMNAEFVATSGTTGTTLNFVIQPSVTMTISSGKVLPANFGISLDAPNNCQISNNTIADNQSPALMTACLGGTWGSGGASGGNFFGGRLAVSSDTSFYGTVNINGLNYDTVFSIGIATNANIAGSVTFLGDTQQAGGSPTYFEPRGLTPAWNLSGSGAGEIDFLCGRDGGGPGGFSFLQVALITVSSGTYNSGTGAVSMTTRVPHGLVSGSVFVVADVAGSGADIAKLNGTQTATTGTTGSTLNFTDSTGLTIASITGATIAPPGSAGGVIDTTVGVSGSLLANDGFGNTRLGGSLVFAPQVAALANAGTVTVNPHVGFVLIQNGSSVATASVILPAPRAGQFADGAEIELNFQNAVGTLAMTAAVGSSIINAPTAVAAAGNSVSFINVGTVWTRRIPM